MLLESVVNITYVYSYYGIKTGDAESIHTSRIEKLNRNKTVDLVIVGK